MEALWSEPFRKKKKKTAESGESRPLADSSCLSGPLIITLSVFIGMVRGAELQMKAADHTLSCKRFSIDVSS